MIRFCLLLLCLMTGLAPDQLPAQTRTVGLLHYGSNAFPGYTLFHPMRSQTTFLIDNCGREVHRWESENTFATGVYLLENGQLLRTATTALDANPVFPVGGAIDKVQLVEWDGTVAWEYAYSDSLVRLHHDVEPMPNGNILMLAWELKTYEEAVAAGRDSSLLPDSVVWAEKIIEVNPVTDEIVWEWHSWDHLVQEADTTAENYAEVGRHPELFNINFTGGASEDGGADWWHVNSIDYHPDRDEIVLNALFTGEFYVIDHSTTTEEAAGHRGGQWNSGGDFLYRWGNPQAYGQGGPDDRQLFNAHDVHWIPDGLDGAGNFMVFHNGNADRPFSSVDIIEPPIDDYLLGSYVYVPGNPFLPLEPLYQYIADPPESFFSSFISGTQRLPNGNILICAGEQGRFFEIDSTEAIVWEYVNPITHDGPLSYDEEIPIYAGRNSNIVFRCTRYGPDYPAFFNHELEPGDPIELLFSEPYDCQLLTRFEEPKPDDALRLFPNPAGVQLIVENTNRRPLPYRIFNALGQLQQKGRLEGEQTTISVGDWPAGLYLFISENGNSRKFVVE